MSSRGLRNPNLKGYQRRKPKLSLDLTIALPGQNGDQEGSSYGFGSQAVQASQPVTPAPIDVDALDDEVLLSSPRAFEEAKNKARRRRGMNLVLDVESGTSGRQTWKGGAIAYRNCYKRRRIPPNQPIINCDQYLESSSSSKNGYHIKPPEQLQSIPPLPLPPPPPPEPIFNCPICMGPFVEEVSTKCGHIFCKKCIKAAISAQTKCPTCRKRVVTKDIHRVYLPATSRG